MKCGDTFRFRGASMNVLTFDVEDWFHVLDDPSGEDVASWSARESRIDRNVDRVLSLLVDEGVRATFFCLGWIAEQHPAAVRRIDAAGYEVGSHSFGHRAVTRLSRIEFAQDLNRSIAALEQVTGKKVRAYRAPGFSITDSTAWAFETLIENGIEIDCSLSPSHYGQTGDALADGPVWIECAAGRLKEPPASGVHWGNIDLASASSGYFRLLPYALTSSLVKRSTYSMSYFHPRDFDMDQPSLKTLSPWRRFKGRVGLRSALAKLHRLLDEFAFVDVGEAVERVDWGAAKCIRTGVISGSFEPEGVIRCAYGPSGGE